MMDPSQELSTADLREFSRKVRQAVATQNERASLGKISPVTKGTSTPGEDGAMSAQRAPDAELMSALEELSVADEELHQQNEELLRSRDALAVERQKYYELFDFAPDAYIITDSKGTILESNIAASHLLGIPPRFLTGKPLQFFFDEDAKLSFRQQLDRLCGAERLDDWEISVVLRSHQRVPVAVSIGRVDGKSPDTAGYRWILRDVTKRKQAEEAVRELNRELELRVTSRTTQLAAANQIKDQLLESERKAREEAEVSNRVKSEFLSLLSHEFRTPLQAIFGYTELLEREIHGPLNPTQLHDLERIRQSQQHLLGLINTILEYAKLDSGQPIDVSFEPVPMQETLNSMEALIGPSLETKALSYTYSCADSGVTAYADRAKVQQIVLNLLANAVKFTPPGGKVELGCSIKPESVEVRVTDSGPGIPADKLESIFQPFVQLRQPGMANVGTGLGLPISRRLAVAMGGSLTAVSDPGVGSTFILRLQRADSRGLRSV